MSSSAADALPEEFLLHIRSTRKGAWKHYVLVRKTIGPDGKNRLVLSPFSTVHVPPEEPIHMGMHDHKYEYVPELMNISFVGHAGNIVVASFLRNPATVQIHGSSPKTAPILYTHKYRELLGPRLKANFLVNHVTNVDYPAVTPLPTSAFLQLGGMIVHNLPPTKPAVVSTPVPAPVVASPAVTATPAPLTIPSPTTGLATAPPPLSSAVNTIEHVQPPTPAPIKVKKVKAPKPAVASTPAPTGPRRGDLVPFVAKQLLALAQIRHDQCPIVAEEFSDGNTAVMPCGHLFAQIAIEESFKKTPNACPACRVPGRPTYV
jgi:hypothetical protein